MKYLLIGLLLFVVSSVSCSKILFLLTAPSKSHAILTDEIVDALASRGHDITYITAFPKLGKKLNYTEIDISPALDKFMKAAEVPKNRFEMQGPVNLLMLFMMSAFANALCPAIMENANVQKFLRENQDQYDLIVGGAYLNEALTSIFQQKLKAPTVAISPTTCLGVCDIVAGNPTEYSYLPHPFLQLDRKMSLLGRVANTVYSILSDIFTYLYYIPAQEKLYKQYVGDDAPPLTSVLYNVSLVLVNQHFTLTYPRPYSAKVKEIAGINVGKSKPLPQDMKKYLDSSKDGAIYFSLGSNLKLSEMPVEKMETFIQAFKKLKVNVLMKWETDDFPWKVDNVQTYKWFPQTDVLAHPNVKLFVTHGGQLSTLEAVWRGVPVIGLPIFGDQIMNMDEAETAGYGKTIEYKLLQTDYVYDAISQVLNDPKYKEAATKKSQLLRDTPLSPMDTAVYWLEYVIRYKGAPHLSSTVNELSWFQLHLLDVYLVIVISLIVTYRLLRIAGVVLCRVCCRKRATTSSKKYN